MKKIWYSLLATLLIFALLKIYSVTVTKINFVESGLFLVILGAFALISMICATFSKIELKVPNIARNIPLGVLSLTTSIAFFWCIKAYFVDTSPAYDSELYPIILCLFCILCSVTFLLLAATHFSGKNIIGSVPFFLYCPLLFFLERILIFISLKTISVDICDFIAVSSLMLFMLYYTQVFATSSNSNITKILFLFGAPSVIFSTIAYLPIVITSNASESVVASSALQFVLALYILAVMLDAQCQCKNHTPQVIKAINEQ